MSLKSKKHFGKLFPFYLGDLVASWYEPEELVGELWHRFISNKTSYTHFPESAVNFEEIAIFLPVFFRAIGGSSIQRFAPTSAITSSHRLGLLKQFGHSQEKISTAKRSGEVIALPKTIAYFPCRKTNRDLYIWLAAYFTCASPMKSFPRDPLQADLAFIQWAAQNCNRTLASFPGIKQKYSNLCGAFLSSRAERKLPPVEARVEEVIRLLLQQGFDSHEGTTPNSSIWNTLYNTFFKEGPSAPTKYRPMLPMPLWGEVAKKIIPHKIRQGDEAQEAPASDRNEEEQSLFKKARRKQFDQAHRKDPLLLNRFEAIQTWAEMLNLARSIDDDDEENAKKTADEADEITLMQHKQRAATKIKLDLDLPPNYLDEERLVGEKLVKEWNFSSKRYMKDHCKIIVQNAVSENNSPPSSTTNQRMIARIRRQFETLRPKRETLRRQMDGYDLDMDALLLSYTDRVVSGTGSDALYLSVKEQARDLSVAILVDTSLSTDAWIEGKQVIEVEKDTLSVMAHGLDACGDRLGIYGFTSRRRDQVFISPIKGFDEQMGPVIEARIASIKPGFYTRIGAAIRHVSAELDLEPSRHRLLLVLTDGKPNDLDHYEGQYGVEDTRMAIKEARQNGQTVYGVTIDKQARDYFPRIFGRGAYSIVGHLGNLPAALPSIYRSITT